VCGVDLGRRVGVIRATGAALATAVEPHRVDAAVVAHEVREAVASSAAHDAHAVQRRACEQSGCRLAVVVARAELAVVVVAEHDDTDARHHRRVKGTARDERDAHTLAERAELDAVRRALARAALPEDIPSPHKQLPILSHGGAVAGARGSVRDALLADAGHGVRGAVVGVGAAAAAAAELGLGPWPTAFSLPSSSVSSANLSPSVSCTTRLRSHSQSSGTIFGIAMPPAPGRRHSLWRY